MALPPSSAGARPRHRLAEALPGTAVTPVGAPGAVGPPPVTLTVQRAAAPRRSGTGAPLALVQERREVGRVGVEREEPIVFTFVVTTNSVS